MIEAAGWQVDDLHCSKQFVPDSMAAGPSVEIYHWLDLICSSAGPVLPHLPDCGKAVDQLVATVTQLQSLSLSRYQLGNTHCVSSATQVGTDESTSGHSCQG